MGLRMRAARPLLTSRCLSRASVTVSRGFSSNGSTFTKSTPKSFLQPRNEMWNGPTSVFSVLSRGYSTIKVKPTELSSIDSASKGLLSSVASVGDYVEEGEVIAVLATDKVTVDIMAPASGKVVNVTKKLDEDVELNDEFIEIDTSAKPEPKKEAPKAEKQETKAATVAPTPKAPSTGRETREAMSPLRKTIADRLKASQNTAAMLTTFQECDMHNLIEMRNRYKDLFQQTHGVKLGFMSAFVKASALALMEQRAINAYIDGNDIVYRDYADISVAVATPTGLLTPVLRDCEKMSFADIEKEIGYLAEKAKQKKIGMADLQGGTFTISNGGVYGSLMGTPILNPPQSAILGMHGTTKRAVVVNDQIVIRPMMYLALTYDHRLIDGREGVTFLKSIKEKIEDPVRMILDL